MPRGKYVNHKGRSRHFTSPEELASARDESSEEDTSSEEEGGNDEAAGTSKAARVKPKPRAKKTSGGGGSSDEDSDEESSEEDDRDARKGVASLIEIENPNRATKKATQKLSNLKLEGAAPSKPELTRREREQIEKQKARARYEKLHAEGKTTEAKADLARLALIRQQRADAAAKREAEKKAVEEKKTSGNKA
ncbi:PREDICTED: 28 kDa heat- and acid-stable phosphoprotein [Rhagoletis zephyria]|uniref:28 kDa heat- and acid-stable phosphoprotein n=1 Tax=Rhagoletis zephyria TaxID=28612 RepID=UPI00081168CA|nr:PREDICTED: 28 kDa heat- and acid-stable phosphoprotein [Rhagoletis zephyria]XP_036339064.1 28 kDa heat- and acid-stable phosphoprotein [Rhagoletis pomonella]